MYNTYAQALLLQGQGEEAFRVVEDLIKTGELPYYDLCMPLLISAIDRGEAELASRSLGWLAHHGRVLEEGLCLRLLTLAAHKKHVNLATQTWNIMSSFK
jgi:hypothetical protein